MPSTEANGGPTGAGPELATERLLLRPVAEADIPAIVELAGDAAVSGWTGSIPHPLDAEAVTAWLASHGAEGERTFAVTAKEDGALIGMIGIMPVAGTPRAEIGYWIGRPYWGRGFATEALRRIVTFAFAELGLARLEAGVFVGNAASARVLEKAGFKACDRRYRPAPARGGNRETVIYALTRIEFARAALSAAVGRE